MLQIQALLACPVSLNAPTEWHIPCAQPFNQRSRPNDTPGSCSESQQLSPITKPDTHPPPPPPPSPIAFPLPPMARRNIHTDQLLPSCFAGRSTYLCSSLQRASLHPLQWGWASSGSGGWTWWCGPLKGQGLPSSSGANGQPQGLTSSHQTYAPSWLSCRLELPPTPLPTPAMLLKKLLGTPFNKPAINAAPAQHVALIYMYVILPHKQRYIA